MRIIDTFCYNGEPIVESRLELLNDVVDMFYIVESCVTFSGIQKSKLYKDEHAEIFKPYLHKIVFIVPEEADFALASGSAWRREEVQRNAPLRRICDDNSDCPFVVIVSDVDEIPRPELVQRLHLHYDQLQAPIELHMEFFYYNFGWMKKFVWKYPYVISDVGLKKQTAPNLDKMRQSPKKGSFANAGWHCSYFETIDNIIRKIESFSHQEHNQESVKMPAYIAQCMKNGDDLFARGQNQDLISYQHFDNLPTCLQTFHKKLVLLQSASASASTII